MAPHWVSDVFCICKHAGYAGYAFGFGLNLTCPGSRCWRQDSASTESLLGLEGLELRRFERGRWTALPDFGRSWCLEMSGNVSIFQLWSRKIRSGCWKTTCFKNLKLFTLPAQWCRKTPTRECRVEPACRNRDSKQNNMSCVSKAYSNGWGQGKPRLLHCRCHAWPQVVPQGRFECGTCIMGHPWLKSHALWNKRWSSMTPGSTTKNNNRNKTQKTSLYLIISNYPKIDVYLILAMLKLIAHPKPPQLPGGLPPWRWRRWRRWDLRPLTGRARKAASSCSSAAWITCGIQISSKSLESTWSHAATS